MFSSFVEDKTYVKMKKPRKNKSLAPNWGRPFFLMKYLDNNGFQEQN
jgi:hypothetical protein